VLLLLRNGAFSALFAGLVRMSLRGRMRSAKVAIMHAKETNMAGAGIKRSSAKAKKVPSRNPSFQGWNTTDAEEVQRRRWRGLTDIGAVEALEPEYPHFGTFRVRSTNGAIYDVEIRSLATAENSCACPDWRINGLGTCKHIEGVIDWLRRKGKRAFEAASRWGNARVEIFPAIDGSCRVLVRPPAGRKDVEAALTKLCDESSAVVGDPLEAVAALRAALASVPEVSVRESHQLEARLEEERRRRHRLAAREQFLAAVTAGTATIDVLRAKLLPYQVEGMLHLAFGERALLADEMGLGKTIQAIAAVELLRRLRGIERVLVVLPASLKAEWEEQIARFTGLAATIVSGPRAERLRQYTAPKLFTLVNYEQVLIDRDDINRLVQPDIVILDEAQRIKNWQTKTAQAVKQLKSPYAFVLTGTPLENRIDEIYSIMQYLDPRILGPLFRFNRDFYVLDERGRPVDYKNLAALRERLAPVMLRRRKDEVEEQLPGRTVDTYFVAMAEEQRLRYLDYEAPAARLTAQAQRRPLSKEEFERLQQLLACMRMICDTPYILDPTCRVSPKLDEFENVLADLLADPERKVIVFSEWERMLELVRELVQEMGLDFAWHTGSVPQDRRRVEIRRFKNDPACRIFLSTDSGSVGLNLQVASAVVNLDLPWNPAKLEQRIARAWRKHQLRTVTVVNLVCENSIEHRILHLLTQKQGLAEGVLDGRGDIAALKMPSGRGAMIERIAGFLTAPPEAAPVAAPDPARRFLAEIGDRLSVLVLSIERRRVDNDAAAMMVILDDAASDDEGKRKVLAEAAERTGLGAIEFVGRSAWNAIRRLADAGIIRLPEADEILHRSPALSDSPDAAAHAIRLRKSRVAADWLDQAERKLRMAALLADGGFCDEASAPVGEAGTMALRGLAIVANPELDPDVAATLPQAELTELSSVRAYLPSGTIASLVSAGSAGAENLEARRAAVRTLLDSARKTVAQAACW
jgi:SNF2-related domain/Helicase conserved C-terminal domain